MNIKLFSALALGLAISVAGTLFFSGGAGALANKKDFNPGNIIDDSVFYNSESMTVSQIQKFLESKNPNCDYDGTKPASDWGYPNLTHAKFAEYKRNGSNGIPKDTGFHAPPYKCLTRYVQDTPQMEAASSYCEALDAGRRTAAEIIIDIARACGINPQVLTILLEKEQSLVTDSWPLNRQLKNATGFACPDTAPCNPAYEGFFYQVYYAARQFKIYQALPNNYNYRANRDNNIYWHPDLSRCGSSTVFIENQATAALYIYTPYRPNSAALNNLYGTGDSCSSYGNRNFWRIFTDWFGGTKLSYKTMKTPRWMQIKYDETYKKIPGMEQDADNNKLSAGQQILFTSKVEIGGRTYLRTAHDTKLGANKAVLYPDALEEIPVVYSELKKPRWLMTTRKLGKMDPITGIEKSTSIPANTYMYFTSKIDIGDNTYLRTKSDTTDNVADSTIPLSDLVDVDVEYNELVIPRWMEATSTTHYKDLLEDSKNIGNAIHKGTQRYFDKKIEINGIWYLSNSTEDSDGTGVPLKDFGDIYLSVKPLVTPRTLQINISTHKQTPLTNSVDGPVLTKGTKISFDQKFEFQGKTYLVASSDSKTKNTNRGVLLSELSELFVSMLIPREMKPVNSTIYRVNVTTGEKFGSPLSVSTPLLFTSKVDINGTTYLRTENDTTNDLNLGVPLGKLEAP